MRIRKRQLTGCQSAELSRDIMRRLLSHPRVGKAKTILMYHSLGDEVDTHDAIDTLVKMGKRVLLPVVMDEGKMEVRLYEGPSKLEKGSFNIKEPSGRKFDSLEDIEVAVIPGVAFDSDNNRLGRGKGYYDRFLTSIPQSYKIGVCFDFQKIESIPADANDVKMDEVL